MKKSWFNLSHYKNIAMEMGKLVPIGLIEAMPGDKFVIRNKLFCRTAPQVFPTMHNVYIKTFWFKVPLRLIFDKFPDFRTRGAQGDDNTPHPYMVAPSPTQDDPVGGYRTGSLEDYLGLPVDVPSFKHSALPHRAYRLVFNEFFRDQTLQGESPLSKGSGLDVTTSRYLEYVCWQKDYFTSALPWEQRGAQVTVPVVSDVTGTVSIPGQSAVIKADGVARNFALDALKGVALANTAQGNQGDAVTVDVPAQNDLQLDIDSQDVSVTSINDLRLAFQLQRFAEKLARYGARYIEFLLGFFGVVSSDKTLQRPQFLGSAVSQIVFSEVLQTSSTDDVSPQGSMAGHGVSGQMTGAINVYCEEDSIILGLAVVQPQTMYTQGMPHIFLNDSPYDYANPTFAHLGEQPIFNSEIFTQADTVVDDKGTPVNKLPFGFAPRYEHLRRIPNTVHGDFRGNLADYHMARIFDDLPVLNSPFVTCSPTNRTFAVQTENNQNIYLTINNDIKALRPIPKRAIPGLIDHN